MMLRKFVLTVFIAGVLGVFGAVPALAGGPGGVWPVIIDTDMVTDDWMAILLTFKNPDFDVKAITVTGTGFAYCDSGTKIALGLVALAGKGDIPVSCWRDEPLFGDNAPPTEWRTTMEVADSLGLPEGGEASDMNAVELFTSTLEASPQKVKVLALGPLTNIGAALDAKPELADKIEMIYIMGGAVDVPGSAVSDENTTAEWNIYSDPYAARLTFESGAPITLVPLDATNDVPVTVDFMEKFKDDQTTPEAQFVYTALSANMESIQSGGYFFWDPLAALVMADPSLVTFKSRTVAVVDVPGAEDGRTKPVGNGPLIDVATRPDGAVFEQLFLDMLNGRIV
jgi:pyrimidine-specific ribonucleoside hydrolase